MRVLVIGSGGREHALCWKLKESKRVKKIYCAPGNGGTGLIGENVDIKADEIDMLLDFALENSIDLTIVGPELPLVEGIVDRFEEKGLKVFGINKSCARLEGSKDFSKEFMERHGIPTATYKTYRNYQDAISGLKDFSYPLVIKADGLCSGKGVIICQDEEEAIRALGDILNSKIFGKEGDQVVIEEFLDGIEASLLCFVTKGKIFPMESAKDYKKIFDGDKGPNTGGVGCYSPSPLFTEGLQRKIKLDILDKISLGLNKDGLDFRGILFIGLMIMGDEIKVLEFNTRFGDPETQVVLPRLESDLVDLFEKTIDGSLEEGHIKWKNDSCLTLIATSKGYPDKYETGFEITGLDSLDKDIIVFHNGTKLDKDIIKTNGGRVLSITSMGKTLEEAREKVYSNVNKISFRGMTYRNDIGK